MRHAKNGSERHADEPAFLMRVDGVVLLRACTPQDG
jgi:hypothetical protein